MTQSILDEAKALVNGERQKDYGHPSVNHQRTADLWSVYLDMPVSREDVCMLNILQKVARSMETITRDTLRDIAGFAANIEMCRPGHKVPWVDSLSAALQDCDPGDETPPQNIAYPDGTIRKR